ncbi:LysM peptidoglycan-binding domain-containing protein [Nocardioides ochotonae]|uniref:LysM peptidoglycan-binding domain-containing protein n=1 Tax=Nocardioides ochotonae TaxID=2685869 RepID=UPI00140E08EB|nr:LysM domain-containing protein [Nocardioides ochotonae]
MATSSPAARGLRTAVVWASATGLALLAHRALVPEVAVLLRGGSDRTFEELLVGVCALLLLACAGWAWLVTTVVSLEALAGIRLAAVPGVPRLARRALLAACGVAVVSGLAVPAGASAPADPGPGLGIALLAGLPLPDRPSGGTRPAPADEPAPAMSAHTVVVAPGDTLWSLARADLVRAGTAPTDLAVQAHTRRVHQLNRDRLGPDPDLIHPGQRLRMPR